MATNIQAATPTKSSTAALRTSPSTGIDAPTLMSAPTSVAAAVLDNPPPSYPALSRRAGEQGTVVLRVWVEASGMPGHIQLQTSSGYERLDAVAKNSVQRATR